MSPTPPASRHHTPRNTVSGVHEKESTEGVPAPTKPAVRDTYHHGQLREALVCAAVQLVAERGVEQLSVREAAKRAGVSPGAPFRHFANRTALLTAVAEQATTQLRQRVEAALESAVHEAPLTRFGAIGQAYLDWARDYPEHFQVVSDRRLIDYESSASLRTDNDAIRTHMQSLLGEALGSRSDTGLAQLAARALVYGLARMAVDGHMAEWDAACPAQQPVQATNAETRVLNYFIGLLQARPQQRTSHR
ncbi:Uncharacterized HTH-type transcriptional regulator yvdT [Delftia tsuruhatensis]|uniref:TetR/AcrR family transcriptional regulator n=1 Tax=Delftia tsuruhatensis TaxID=180282 RepID=UPI001E730054|nr:TetR/AcrR family transcriptional regulator [Delftia tsuruhatensis]CAB5713351.1 Uncharacterized HTH-type transcriptional regulator yvdT [Delftia tsuruhatensis]CAC9692005.1 Uncharacterized HTH-type transcriptional regulator yvdT [Delftia tsuruhatensis]